MEIELGMKYKDKITGFTGVATGICSYITGCDQVLLQASCKKNDKAEAVWFDDMRLVHVKAKKLNLEPSVKTGACDPAPIK